MSIRQRHELLTLIACLFYAVGWVGMVFFDVQYMARLTPLNLLITLLLLALSVEEWTQSLLLFAGGVFLGGMLVEIIGVNTGLLFGEYVYGSVMGWKIGAVPLLIGVNWLILMYCIGVFTDTFLPAEKWVRVLAGATLAFALDYFLEKVAIRLDFWQWRQGEVPFKNYLSWFAVSGGMQAWFHTARIPKRNQFAINLLMIQIIFFFTLSWLLS